MKLLTFAPVEPMYAQPELPLGLRSTSKPSSFGLPWLSFQLSRIDEVDTGVATRFDGAARDPDTVVLVVDDVLVLVTELEVGTLVLVVEGAVSVALATLDQPEKLALRVARTR